MILLHPTYFSPIIQYAAIVQSNQYQFEIEDNFQKQTYRTRCYIYGANGKQLLNVPIKHSKKSIKTKTKDLRIDNESIQWQKIHQKSLQAAYKSSPFFEFYEDELFAILNKKHSFLLDLNLDLHSFIMDALQEDNTYIKSTEYDQDFPKEKDFRSLSNAKTKTTDIFPSYIQMFDEKFGFLHNLSILDLLFMEGPSTSIYLKKLDLSTIDL